MNRIRILGGAVALFVFILVLPAPATAQRCAHEAQRSAIAPVSGVERVHIIAHAGSLEIEGSTGTADIAARGRACASDVDDLSDLRLTVRRDGAVLVVEAHQPDDDFDGDRGYAYINLVVALPAGTSVTIDDGSGDMTVRAVGSLRIDDGSGDIRVRGASGNVDIEDGSGDIELADVGGDVEIEDGSGEIYVSRVRGSVHIDDGSGDIRVVDVTRDVHVDDGSGTIRVERVHGDFVVDDDGSGGVRHRDIGGRVSVPDDD